jgi:hypothetical protein
VYPVLFRIGSFEVTSFGAMLALAALVGLWLFVARSSSRDHRSMPLMREWSVFGVRLFLDEVVTRRDPPFDKVWETVGGSNASYVARRS